MNLSRRRYIHAASEIDMMLCFWNTIRLARMKADQTLIGCQRGVVSVYRIERQIGRSGQMEYFRTRQLKLAAQLIVLRLCGGELRPVEKSQLLPAVSLGSNVPTGSARRTYQHALQRGHHGMAVDTSSTSDCTFDSIPGPGWPVQRLQPPSRSAI